MAAFSHCHFHLPFLLDSSAFGDQPLINSTPIPHTSSSDETNQSSTMTTVLDYHEPSLTRTHSPAADTSMAQTKKKKNKKRTNYRNGTSSKEGRTEGRSKKQKKSDDSNSYGNGAGKQEEKPKITQVPPTGYIHVRARRGEATDSHSLAERVRREKISERMMMLQRLVPGCDKITGKALVLDEIINYVQSLQTQVEFLSTKLASVNPMFGDFTMGQDTLMATPDRLINSVTLPLPSVPQCSTNQTTNFAHDYSLLDDSVTVFLQGERSNAFFSSQLDFVGELWDAQDQGQNFPNPCDFDTSLWSFQS